MNRERFVLCTGNRGKSEEIRSILPASIELLDLAAVDLPSDLPETGDSLEANALQKARYAFERCGIPCIADDTGLEVKALNGAPGVHSARYASESKDAATNMAKLLKAMEGIEDRNARFRTVIAVVRAEGELLFEGVVNGWIADEARGEGGFGYDPIFVPDGFALTFAQMDMAEKNRIGHRGKAIQELLSWMQDRGAH